MLSLMQVFAVISIAQFIVVFAALGFGDAVIVLWVVATMITGHVGGALLAYGLFGKRVKR
jgi:hypothetical protein